MPQPQSEEELFRIVPELKLIASLAVKELVVSTFLHLVDERYWDAPSSFSGKFHLVPDGNGRVDTQIDSCRRTARIAHHLSNLYGLNPIGTDTVVAASLLHDIEAGNPNWDKTHPNHAQLAADLILSTNGYASSPWDNGSDWQSVVKDIAYCVQHHMSWWGGENWDSVCWKNNTMIAKGAQIVAIGDYLSSRADIWVVLPEDQLAITGKQVYIDVLLENDKDSRTMVMETTTVFNKLIEWAKKWDGSIEVRELSPLLGRLDKALKKWKHE
jgi:hypothetical protein